MNWVKKLLGKKEDKVIEVPLDPNREIRGYCANCGKIIEIGEPWTKQVGNHYHRRCWKEMVKSAW